MSRGVYDSVTSVTHAAGQDDVIDSGLDTLPAVLRAASHHVRTIPLINPLAQAAASAGAAHRRACAIKSTPGSQ